MKNKKIKCPNYGYKPCNLFNCDGEHNPLPKTSWEEEWDRIAESIWGDTGMETAPYKIKLFISKTLTSQREELLKESDYSHGYADAQIKTRQEIIEEILMKLPREEKAHTYSSENADIYRAYDKGQKDYKEIIKILLKSLKK